MLHYTNQLFMPSCFLQSCPKRLAARGVVWNEFSPTLRIFHRADEVAERHDAKLLNFVNEIGRIMSFQPLFHVHI